jgi:hypothetical protein
MLNVSELFYAATEHYERLVADIPLAKTRDEHVRVTARANEAAAIVESLNYFRNLEGGVPDA